MDKTALTDTACDELLTYGLWDAKTKVKRWIKKNMFRRPVDVEDLIFWPTGLLAAGLWQYRNELPADISRRGDVRASGREGAFAAGRRDALKQIDKALAGYYERWMRRGCPITYLDDLLAGETMLAIYEEYSRNKTENNIIDENNAEQYRKAVEKLAQYALAYPRDEMGSLPYRSAHNDGHIYVDSIGLTCPFMYEYGNFFNKSECVELAVKQIVSFLAYGMDGSTGLPYHGYEVHSGIKYGIIGWGRAAGWLLRGMAGCMTTEYGMKRLKDSYIRLVDTVLSYQRKDGYYSWQLQASDGPKDTSATGMICVALKHGMELNILTDSKYEQALLAGTNAIERSIRNGNVYDCSGECEGFGQYPQRYGAYPWALGPALML